MHFLLVLFVVLHILILMMPMCFIWWWSSAPFHSRQWRMDVRQMFWFRAMSWYVWLVFGMKDTGK